jgi:hypothetical protein
LIDLERALQELHRGGVEFIIIGGVAATIHGSARVSQDLDIVYARTHENLARLAASLPHTAPIFGVRRLGCPSGGMPRRSGAALTSP